MKKTVCYSLISTVLICTATITLAPVSVFAQEPQEKLLFAQSKEIVTSFSKQMSLSPRYMEIYVEREVRYSGFPSYEAAYSFVPPPTYSCSEDMGGATLATGILHLKSYVVGGAGLSDKIVVATYAGTLTFQP